MDIKRLPKASLLKMLNDKKSELEKAVTVGEYWSIECEINTINQQLKDYDYGTKN